MMGKSQDRAEKITENKDALEAVTSNSKKKSKLEDAAEKAAEGDGTENIDAVVGDLTDDFEEIDPVVNAEDDFEEFTPAE